MRLLRALAHLVLALALIGVAVAPARAVGFLPVATHENHMGDHASGVHAEHAAHEHGSAASEQLPTHKRDGCQTACCFIPSQLPPPVSDTTAVEFFCAVRYVDATRLASGRADAPDPGIPKSLS
jgi:hypothetical protein